MSRSETRWWRAEDAHLYSMVLAGVGDAYLSASSRLDGYERGLRFYADKCEVQFSGRGAPPARLEFNLIRTLAQTARAHLVAYPAPRPQVQTKGADFAVQQRAKGLSRWMDGAIHAAKMDAVVRGPVALRSAVMGDGVVRYRGRFGRVLTEAVRPWELFAHEEDEQAGEVRTLYHAYRADRGILAHEYPDHAKEIDTRTGASVLPWGERGSDDGHRIAVLEAWHLPSAPDAEDGRHVVLIQDQVLSGEEWASPDFPFSRLPWSEPLSGWWSTGLADSCGPIQRKINELLNKLQAAIDLCVWPRLLVPRTSKVAPWPPTNEIGSIAYYSGNVPPQWDIARKIDPEIAGQIERLWSKAFQQEGISELAASAMKPGGLDSGKAILAFADKASGRMANWSVLEQNLYTDSGHQVRRLGQRMAKEDPDFSVTVRGGKRGKLETVRFLSVDLDDGSFEVEALPVSSLPSTPAGRRAVLQEDFAAGIYTLEQYARLEDNPDMEAERALADAPRNYLLGVLEEMVSGDGTYVPPEPFDDLAAALILVRSYYAKARTDSVPEERLELLRRYAAAVVAEQKRLAAAAAPPPAPPGAPPMPSPDALPPEMAGAPPPDMMAGAPPV